MTIDRLHAGFVTADGVHNLSPREVLEWCEQGAVILDLRDEYINQFKKFDVPNIVQIPLDQLSDKLDQLPKDKLIIVADSSGLHSKEACRVLEQTGFTQVSNLAGGFVEWERDGMPLVTDKGERLSGSCACQLRARETKNSGNT
jgi:rhodanese-related sulfurtransferase